MIRLDPDAWALTDDPELDAREGVQDVDARMIYDYVTDPSVGELPPYSARPFADWLHRNWYEFTECRTGEGLVTNRDVIHGAIIDWCGGRTR